MSPRERLAVVPESEGSSSVLTTALEIVLVLRTSHVLRILDYLQPPAFQNNWKPIPIRGPAGHEMKRRGRKIDNRGDAFAG